MTSVAVWCALVALLLVVDALAWLGLLPIDTLTVTLWRVQRAHAWIGYALLGTLIALTVHLVILPAPWEGHP
ncbi:MAG: hypothetical protein QJR02_10310 [Sinobacteraceae bacterium]|nr:hypothetical protein [Nevskiaceae bacterium]